MLRQKSRQQISRLLSRSAFAGKARVCESADLRCGWLLPGGYGVQIGAYEHGDVADVLGFDNHISPFFIGWVRKADDCSYQFDAASRAAVAELECHLAARFHAGGLRFRDPVFLDTFDSGLGINFETSYAFTKRDFDYELGSLAAIMRDERYEVH